MKKLVSLILALVLLSSMCIPAMAESVTMSYADTIAWDAEYDVVVIGFGGAGAAAGIAAEEEGANVLITEKAPVGHEGGNSRYAYQIILNYTDYDAGVAYLKAECEGMDNMTDEIIDFIVRGSMENGDWLESIGIARPENKMLGGEYPELPGADHVWFSYVPDTGAASGKHYWESLRAGVVDRKENIDVWFESPAKHLIQDPFTKTILGVEIEHEGEMVNVRARNGVVLACGGFENNPEMLEHYTQREELYPIGTLYNTGDGINMAIEVGADLWHMAALSGPWLTLFNDETVSPQCWFNQPSMSMNLAADAGGIYVGPDGTRFTNESGLHRHGHTSYSGSFYSTVTPYPMYMIFDEDSRLAGPIMPTFSEDMSAEIESGLIVKADTIAELAEKIGVQAYGPKENVTTMQDGITARVDLTHQRAGLVYQVELYNRYCEEGYDEQFDRRADTLKPIDNGPFYAIKIVPAIVNTQGGPVRNTNCEIIDTNGNVIPHLYGAGELGSMYGGWYTAGGNLAETLFSGRVAGRNAAAVKEEVPAFTLTAVESNIRDFAGAFEDNGETVELAEGEAIGTAIGMGGDVKVKVTTADGKITAVEVIEHHETPAISDPAIEQIPGAIVAAGSTDVEIISGATITCKAIMQAVDNALSSK